MMKKPLTVLALSILPALAWAVGGHSGGHDAPAHGMPGHDMSTMSSAPSAIGRPGDPAKVTRTVELKMEDSMRFTPNEIQVKAGETIRFFVKNTGQIPHEMVIGTVADLKTHAAEMQKMSGMKHAEPNMITLAAGKIGGLVWTFDQPGTVDFACLVPGHMEAGMVGKVKVS
ncbi:MAG: hypothetical protein EPN31_07495 [Castellaniella sp.]|nr:MAG: hypothetical protein EPN31_07495 [Castellaniella sp.]